MIIFLILGSVVLITVVVLSILFYMLAKEEEKEKEKAFFKETGERQLNEARQMVETLTKEGQALKSQLAEFEHAKQKLLETANNKLRLLEEEMASVKIQMGEEISKAKEMVTELNREKGDLQKRENFESTNQQLQYELIKAKAQSSGQERVSFNYKNQLENSFKKVNELQAANDQLSQLKDRLEATLEEIKLQNEELVKKDHLAEFELEKNRSRLVALERENEDLKARMPQKDKQV